MQFHITDEMGYSFGTINLCGAFWDAPATGTDSKAGTLVHEVSNNKSSQIPTNSQITDDIFL